MHLFPKTMQVVSKIPLTYMWYLKRLVDSPKTVLDLGCGNGELIKQIYSRDWKITGIDIYEKSLKEADKLGVYKMLIKGDLIKVCTGLIKKKKKFDLVFCSQVIEHISKNDGSKLLDLAEKLAKKRVYFGTPRGFMNQPEIFIKGNPHQYHKSGWSIDEFKKKGYKVYGIGLYPVWSERGLARGENGLTVLVSKLVSYTLSPVTFLIPSLASGMMALKIR